MTTYGLTDTGFLVPGIDDILAEIKAELLAQISPNLDLESTGLLGIVAGIVATREALLWQTLQEIYAAGDPGQAERNALDVLCALTGTRRAPATRSKAPLSLTLDANTTVPAESIVRVAGSPTIRFRTKSAVTSTGAGTYSVLSESEETGPVHANAGTLTDIVTAVSGWRAVTNPADATLGRLEQSDSELRAQREQELAAAGAGTADAIRGKLLAYVDVTGAQPIVQAGVYQNVTDATDANGLPPHSVEALIYDPAAMPNNDVAQLLWDHGVAAGIATYGNASGVATDSEGVQHTMRFSRATPVEVLIEVSLLVDDDWPTNGVDLVKSVVTGYSWAQGGTVYRSLLYPGLLDIAGVKAVTRVRACRVGGTLADADLTMALREIAFTQSADVTVIVTS